MNINIFYNKNTLIYGNIYLKELFDKNNMKTIINNINNKYYYTKYPNILILRG